MFTKRPNIARSAALAAIVAGGILAQSGETDPTDGRPAWRSEEVTEGVFFATGTGAMTAMSNSLVIVNHDHATVVDTSVSPAAARKLVAEIRSEVTEKPIRYVFNTHFHFDQSHGNQVFGDEFVREQHLANVLEQRRTGRFRQPSRGGSSSFGSKLPPRATG